MEYTPMVDLYAGGFGFVPWGEHVQQPYRALILVLPLEESSPLHWTPFAYGPQTYDLAHLYPRALEFVRAETDEKPSITYFVDLTFSMHCFSRSLPKLGPYNRALEYSDARETRYFDFDRYRLSKLLPGIMETLVERKCRHTGRGNFFTVEIVTEAGIAVDYDIFFTTSKSSRKGRINVYVQSAYVKDRQKLPAGKPVRFLIVLHNTLHGIPIKD